MKNFLIVFLVMPLLMFSDILRVNGEEKSGIFVSFEKGKFSFQEWEAERPGVYDAIQVDRLKLDKPVKVTYSSTRAPKKKEAALLKGYRKRNFQLIIDGKEEAVVSFNVASIIGTIDMAEFMRRRDEAKAKTDEEAREERGAQGASAASLAVKGKASIVHFHDPESHASTRQGNLANSIAEKSRGKIEYVQVTIESLDDPTAKRNKLKSLPQFWFYDANGKRTSKLDEQFTEEQIEAAAQKARKGR